MTILERAVAFDRRIVDRETITWIPAAIMSTRSIVNAELAAGLQHLTHWRPLFAKLEMQSEHKLPVYPCLQFVSVNPVLLRVMTGIQLSSKGHL
jgi:hypothetical protein